MDSSKLIEMMEFVRDRSLAIDNITIIRNGYDDHPTNGMALCKLCHWAFDRGMVGVSRDYKVITARQIGVDPNVPGVLQTMAGRGVLPPVDRDLWPAQEFLGWHRKEFRLNA